MDFKDWKKTSEDGKSVTMQHPKGHEMVILLKGVPSIQKEALKRLPLYDGGEVKGVHKEDPNKKGRSMAGKELNDSKLHKELKQPFSERIAKDDAKEEHRRVLGEIKSMPNPKLKGLAHGGSTNLNNHGEGGSGQGVGGNIGPEGGSSTQASMNNAFHTPDSNAPSLWDRAKSFVGSDSAEAQEPQNKAMGGVAHYDEGTPNAPVSQSDAQPQPAPQPQFQPVQENSMDQAVGNYQDPAARISDAYKSGTNSLNKVQETVIKNQNAFDQAKAGWDNFNNDPKSNIDADEYRKNMTLPDKVSTGIGLFLGGFSVPFGGHNFAQDFLDKQISNNIDAQKENYTHQKNVYGAAKDLFANNMAATNFAHTVALDQTKNLVSQAAMKQPGNPVVQTRAQNLIGSINAKQADLKKHSAQVMTADQLNVSGVPLRPGQTPQEDQSWAQAAAKFAAPWLGSNKSAASSGQPTPQPANPTQDANAPLIEPDDYADTPILKNPSAIKSELATTSQVNPFLQKDRDNMSEEFGRAQQADAVLGQLRNRMAMMGALTKNASAAEYLRRHDPLNSVPWVGNALSQILVDPATDTQRTRIYKGNQDALTNDIASAFRGTNVGGEEIKKIVQDYSPEKGDSPEDIAWKERQIRMFIKNGIVTPKLDIHGHTNRHEKR